MPFQTPEDVLTHYQKFFPEEQAADLNLTAQLHLEGENGGDWAFRITNGKLTTERGTIENPDFALEATVADFLAMANGQLDPMKAYFTGKVRFHGSMRQAMRLMNRFRFNP